MGQVTLQLDILQKRIPYIDTVATNKNNSPNKQKKKPKKKIFKKISQKTIKIGKRKKKSNNCAYYW
jgi:hypothetical protein